MIKKYNSATILGRTAKKFTQENVFLPQKPLRDSG